MSQRVQNKQVKKKKNAPKKKTAKELFSSLKQMFVIKEQDDEMEITRRENIRFIVGAVLSLISSFIILSLVSHIFTGAEDQKLLSDPDAIAANWMGNWGAEIAQFMIMETFGLASIFIPIMLLATSIRIMRIYDLRLHKWFLNCTILMIWISAALSYVSITLPFLETSHISLGGAIGLKQIELVRAKIGTPGLFMVLLVVAVCYLGYLSDEAISYLRSLLVIKKKEEPLPDEAEMGTGEEEEMAEEECTELTDETEQPTEEPTEEAKEEEGMPHDDNPEDTATTIEFTDIAAAPAKSENVNAVEMEIVIEDTSKNEEEKAEEPSAESASQLNMKVSEGVGPEPADIKETEALEPYDPKLDLSRYKYPTLNLLKKYDETGNLIDMEEQNKNKEQIINVLNDFGVSITSIKATVGPTITLYEVTPAPGVRISKIRNLEDDIALSLRALGIRIIAPIPGKGTIGIEVPNAKPQMVSMESILNSRKFKETDYELPLALGKTITNEIYMVDLAKMPHLLVAGATGQGKSVGLNAIVTSLLYKKHPAELKLVMVDPKKVEFSIYSPIVNHFLAQVEGNEDDDPIITDVNKVVQTLKSLCVEMDTRYDLLKKARCRNVKEYNQQFKNRKLNPENGHRFMPYIVVIIDEFGDLIMTAGREIELPIARIAQLARAVGIHMIIATQRPTTNIITGTIKANFPARMAFKVSAMVDSRTILDRPGANQLVGKGDMLFLSGNEPVRVQCAFVDTPEVEGICMHVACQQSYLGPHLLPRVEMEGDDEGCADVDMAHLDPMFEEVARMVVTEQSGSTSMIQRKFSIGYNRAGRLMDQLEKAGIVGSAKGSKPREVLCISEEDLQFRLDNLR